MRMSLLAPQAAAGGAADVVPLGRAAGLTALQYQTNNATYNVRDFGAAGNDVTDDTAAILATIAAAPAGAVVRIPYGVYRISQRITLGKALRVHSEGAYFRQVAAGTGGLLVTAGGVLVEALTLLGLDGSATAAAGVYAVEVAGASAAAPLAGVALVDVGAQDWHAGVWARHVDSLVIENAELRALSYAGVMALSVSRSRVRHTRVRDVACIDVGGGVLNGYGIAISRAQGTLAAEPRSSDVHVDRCTVDGVTGWEAYDTHGGEGIRFTRNRARNVKRGVAIGPSTDETAAATIAPLRCEVEGNDLDSGVTDGSAGYGVSFAGALNGAALLEAATGAVRGNLVRGFGDQSNDQSGAIYTYATRRLAVDGNDIEEPGGAGVMVSLQSWDIHVTGNRIADAWTETSLGNGAVGIHFRDGYVSGLVQGNTFADTGARAGALMACNHAVRLANVAADGSAVDVGPNRQGYANYIQDVGGKVTQLGGGASGAPQVLYSSTALGQAAIQSATPQHTYTIPAGTLAVGDVLEIVYQLRRVSGNTGAFAQVGFGAARTGQLGFGGAEAGVVLRCRVAVTAAGAQFFSGEVVRPTTTTSSHVAATEAISGAISITLNWTSNLADVMAVDSFSVVRIAPTP